MYQKLTIAGALGKDPEMRYTPEGKALTWFNVAVGEGSRDKRTTAWFRVTTFGESAENCNRYLQKGSKVLVVGRLQYDTATGSPKIFNRTDGTAGTSFEVAAERVVFLSSKTDGGAADVGDA